MIKLDDNLLAELGLQSLPPEEKKNLLRHIYETLEMRVGTTLAQQMTDAQLDEFEAFINANDEAGALRWLETNFPNYKDVVAQEFDKLKAEVRQAAPQILADVASRPPAPAAPVAMPQQHYQQYPGQQQQYAPNPNMSSQPMPDGYYGQPAQQPVAPQYPQPPQAPAYSQPQQSPAPAQYQQPYPQQPPDQSQYGPAA